MPTLEKTAGKLALVKLEYHPTIHDMPTDERPRERLKHYGPKALSTAELLAIILRTGTSRDNVIELAGKLLAKYGGLSGLMRADFGELCSEHGLGEAKASQLKAALEIGRRLGMLQNEEKYQLTSSPRINPGDASSREGAFLLRRGLPDVAFTAPGLTASPQADTASPAANTFLAAL